jgi:hypothetical protein
MKKKELVAIEKLKQFLYFKPESDFIRDVLQTSVVQLIDTHPDVIAWLMAYPDCLAPELNLTEVITHELSQKLLSWGFLEQDFTFDNRGNLALGPGLQDALVRRDQRFQDEPAMALIRALVKVDLVQTGRDSAYPEL